MPPDPHAEFAAAFALRHCAWCGAPARSVVIGIPPGPDHNRCLGCAGEVVPGPWPVLRSERTGKTPKATARGGSVMGPPLACSGA
jgi:hypothetical protein